MIGRIYHYDSDFSIKTELKYNNGLPDAWPIPKAPLSQKRARAASFLHIHPFYSHREVYTVILARKKLISSIEEENCAVEGLHQKHVAGTYDFNNGWRVRTLNGCV